MHVQIGIWQFGLGGGYAYALDVGGNIPQAFFIGGCRCPHHISQNHNLMYIHEDYYNICNTYNLINAATNINYLICCLLFTLKGLSGYVSIYISMLET